MTTTDPRAFRVVALGDARPAFDGLIAALGAAGHAVDRAGDASRLLGMLSETPADAVLLDAPDTAGDVRSTLDVVREVAPGVPVIRRVAAGAVDDVPEDAWPLAEDVPHDVAIRQIVRIVALAARARTSDAEARTLRSRSLADRARAHRVQTQTRETLHELGTTTTVIRGFVDNLLDGYAEPLAPGQRDALDRTRAACGQMAELLRSVREGIAAEGAPAEDPADDPRAARRRHVRMPDLADEVVRLFERPYADKGVRLALHADPECPVVWGDRVRLIQLLTNLLSNALRHVPGGGTVDVTVGGEKGGGADDAAGAEAGRRAVRVTVSDDGPGIAPQDRERAFEAGWTGGGDAPGDRQGLGLAICREVASEHGARLWIDEGPAGGAAFHLVLPADPRSRRVPTRVTVVEDLALVGQWLLELRAKSDGAVPVVEAGNLEDLAALAGGGGASVLLLGTAATDLHRVIERLRKGR